MKLSPLQWFGLALAAVAAYVFIAPKAQAANYGTIPAGAGRYTVNKQTPFYTSDPSAQTGTGGVNAAGGVLPLGTVVYATSTPPNMSANAAYEQVATPSNGQVWVLISDLTVAPS
jgi:hypothetical protein